MPFYNVDSMELKKDTFGPDKKMIAGEFMKIGVVTHPVEKEPNPHFHPNEEQFMLVLDGKINMVLGDEQKILTRGDIVHIPRNTSHGIKVIEGPAVFFAVKSPIGNGELSGDYTNVHNAEELKAKLLSY